MVRTALGQQFHRRGKRALKRLRRLRSHLQAAVLRVRNVASRKAVVGDTPVVVSLTTYGERLQSVAIAIESIAAGTKRPARLILWLDDEQQLPGGKLPAALLRLQRRGLEISRTPNVGPHGKYYGYVSSHKNHSIPMVTADDDIMYPRRWLAALFAAHLQHPEGIHCYWARQVVLTDAVMAPYEQWPAATDTAARSGNFAVGVSGVIYPAPMLDSLAARDRAFDALCPRADDIWLHWVALQQGIKIRQIENKAHHFPIIPGTQGQSLLSNNVAGGGNDVCLQKMYTKGDISALTSAQTVQVA